MRVIAILMIIGDIMMDEGPLEEGIQIGVEGHGIEGITTIEVTLDGGRPPDDPLMMDPLEMEEIQDALEDEDHQAHQDPLVQ